MASQEVAQQIRHRINQKMYQKAYDELLQFQRNSTLSFELLQYRLVCEEKLNKTEAALKTCNFLLFIQPNNQNLHIHKLQILKTMQKFKEISDQLLIIKQLFPEVNLMQI